MRIRHLIILLTVILLAAAGCQRIEKAGSDAESMPKESVDAPKESSKDAEMESGGSGQKTTSGSEQGTKEEQKPETEQQTGPETETVPDEKPIELVYELEPDPDFYFFGAEGKKKDVDYIEKVGDVYRVTGHKIYAGPVLISWEQKALLDAGAELKIMYKGNEVDRIKAKLSRIYRDGGWQDCVAYEGKHSYMIYANLITQDMKNNDQYRKERIFPFVDLDDSLYEGLGFFFDVEIIYGHTPLFGLYFEEDVVLEIPKDTEIGPYGYLSWDYPWRDIALYEEIANRIWTFEEYYEEMKEYLVYGFYGEIYEEGGRVVYILEPYSS